jgi:hypothetical protein
MNKISMLNWRDSNELMNVSKYFSYQVCFLQMMDKILRIDRWFFTTEGIG